MAPKKKQQQPAAHKSKAQEEEELLKQFAQESKATSAKNNNKNNNTGSKGGAAATASSEPLTLAERKAAHAAAKHAEVTKDSEQNAELLRRQLERARLQQMFAQMQELQRYQSPFLRSPKTDVEIEEAAGSKVVKGASCVASVQGWRNHMEDDHIMQPEFDKEAGLALFAVFDGHSGVKAANMCRTLLPLQFNALRKGAVTNLDAALKETYQVLDGKMKGKVADDSGCTAVTVAVSETHITCASVGDSRAVLCRGGKAIPLAFDHKPKNPEEEARIRAAGGHTEANRVNGMLAMSRAIGDFKFKSDPKLPADKQLVIAVPDIITEKRDAANDEFLVVACDGVWDCFSNQELCDVVTAAFAAESAKTDEASKKKSLLARVTEAVSLKCVTAPHPHAPGSPSTPHGTDNVTLMIVQLK